MVQGCLCLLGHTRKNLAAWPKVQSALKNYSAVQRDMMELGLGAEDKEMAKRWDEMQVPAPRQALSRCASDALWLPSA